MNPVSYFEIAVTDLDRAVLFYEAVFDVELEKLTVDGYRMALFPAAESGASGALAEGDVYRPTVDGAILYFDVVDIENVMRRVLDVGGEELLAKRRVDNDMSVAEFRDSEGNRIALLERPTG